MVRGEPTPHDLVMRPMGGVVVAVQNKEGPLQMASLEASGLGLSSLEAAVGGEGQRG